MSVKNRLIKLAYENPHLRGDLLPIIMGGGDTTKTSFHRVGDYHRIGKVVFDDMFFTVFNAALSLTPHIDSTIEHIAEKLEKVYPNKAIKVEHRDGTILVNKEIFLKTVGGPEHYMVEFEDELNRRVQVSNGDPELQSPATLKLARREPSQKEIGALKEVSKSFLLAARTKDVSGLKSAIYEFYTRDYDNYDRAMALHSDQLLKKQYDTYWNNVKSAMEASCRNLGWEYNDGGAWTQFTKPFQGDAQHGTGNFKRYITLEKGVNFTTFFENAKKLPTLLKNIHEAPTTGKVSFKIESYIVPSLAHKDVVVIHYKDGSNAPLIEEAVKKTGFTLTDRGSLGRTDTGVDTPGQSDSEVVALKAAHNMISSPNSDHLVKWLTSGDPKTYMEGISGLYHIISEVMLKSSHRNSRK